MQQNDADPALEPAPDFAKDRPVPAATWWRRLGN